MSSNPFYLPLPKFHTWLNEMMIMFAYLDERVKGAEALLFVQEEAVSLSNFVALFCSSQVAKAEFRFSFLNFVCLLMKQQRA